LAGLSEEGIAILIVEQFARTALAIADYGAVMVGGRIAHVGQPEDLHDAIEEAYLGAAS
jgi:ABC-type branched-subunit amino acid transport system ATPase component